MNKLLVLLLAFTSSTIVAMDSSISIADLTTESAENFIAKHADAIISVSTTWCAPCKVMKPVFEELARELSSSYVCARVDGDTSKELIAQWGVNSFPSFVIFKEGKKVGMLSGAKSKDDFKQRLLELTTTFNFLELDEPARLNRFQTAIQEGDIAVVKVLLDLGLSSKQTLPAGMPPLFVAAQIALMQGEKMLPVMKVLIDAGADIHQTITLGDKELSCKDLLNVTRANCTSIVAVHDAATALLKQQSKNK